MQFLKNIRVAIRLPLVVVMALVALVGFALLSMSTLNTVKLGGPEANKVMEQNALLADILPPPGYLVETDLSVYQARAALAAGNAAIVDEELSHLTTLVGQFRDRMGFWGDALRGTSQAAAVARINDTGEAYLSVLENNFIPALEKSDVRAADKAATSLETLFLAHRSAVDEATKVITDATDAQVKHAASLTSSRSNLLWTILIVTLILVGGAAILVTLSVLRPLNELRENMEDIAAGDGSNADARLDANRRDEFGQLATAFNEFADKLVAFSSEVQQNARIAERRAVEVAESASLAAESMNSVAGATTQLSAAAAEIARSAGEASNTSQSAVRAADDANALMERLAESSDRIGAVVESIRRIAELTKLLALNATIEAARAGEAGRGFAVVAGEVKDLATETDLATGDIVDRVQAIRQDSRAALIALNQVVTVINDIGNSQQVIAAAVEEHAVTTSEIDRSLTDAVTAVNQLATSGV